MQPERGRMQTNTYKEADRTTSLTYLREVIFVIREICSWLHQSRVDG